MHRPLAPHVVAALERQNGCFAPSPQRDANLRALAEGAAAVVTGQQVGLFLGPVYNLYKAATAVRAAATLRKRCGTPVVPVFWLQSEDHDVVEVATHNTLSESGIPLSLSVPVDPEERRSLAHQRLPAEVEQRLEDMRSVLERLPRGAAHVDRLRRHYQAGRGWVEAFAGLLAEFFGEAGLVLIDARDDAFAPEQRALHDHALRDAIPIAADLAARAEELQHQQRPVPVHVRAGAPLSFFHPHGRSGPRCRLIPDGGTWREVGSDGRHGLDELLAALDDDPFRFSSSALLRPILQDMILPTAVYVGGATEVAYFEQITPLYGAFDLRKPVVLERSSFRIIGDRCARLLERWGLRAGDCEATPEVILEHLAAGTGAAEDLSHVLLDPFVENLDGLAPKLISVDADLAAAIDKARTSVAGAVARLAHRYERSCLRRNQQIVHDVAVLSAAIYPDRQPQERFYGLSGFAARYGEEEFVSAVIAAAEPFAAERRDLRCRPLPFATTHDEFHA